MDEDAVKIKRRFCCPDCTKTRRSRGRKGEWSIEEDDMVLKLVATLGTKSWVAIAKSISGRTGKQCRERWVNQLDPSISKQRWSVDEDAILMRAHASLGNRWTEIAAQLPGRTENNIKNNWNQLHRRNIKASPIKPPRVGAGVGPVPASVSDETEHDAVALLLGLTKSSPSPSSIATGRSLSASPSNSVPLSSTDGHIDGSDSEADSVSSRSSHGFNGARRSPVPIQATPAATFGAIAMPIASTSSLTAPTAQPQRRIPSPTTTVVPDAGVLAAMVAAMSGASSTANR